MELGSEFNLSLSELTIVKDNIFSYINHEGLKSSYFDSGRSALRYLGQCVRIDEEVLLPDFICESVIRSFLPGRIQFYRTDNSFTADVEDIRQKISSRTKVIFIMHYFGSLQPSAVLEQIHELSESKGIIIIEDATHSLFTSVHTIGDYVIASIRKWMQTPGGAVMLSSEKQDVSGLKKQEDNTKASGMVLKDLFLNRGIDCNPTYRSIFTESEKKLDFQEDIFCVSDFSEFIMKCVDIPLLIQKRRHNYEYLKKLLGKRGIDPAIAIGEDCCPLVLPLRVPERDRFRKYLNENRIYCAVHWPKDGIREGERAQALKNSNELISLPIDQRYNEEHLNYLDSVIGRYRGDLRF